MLTFITIYEGYIEDHIRIQIKDQKSLVFPHLESKTLRLIMDCVATDQNYKINLITERLDGKSKREDDFASP